MDMLRPPPGVALDITTWVSCLFFFPAELTERRTSKSDVGAPRALLSLLLPAPSAGQRVGRPMCRGPRAFPSSPTARDESIACRFAAKQVPSDGELDGRMRQGNFRRRLSRRRVRQLTHHIPSIYHPDVFLPFVLLSAPTDHVFCMIFRYVFPSLPPAPRPFSFCQM